MSRNQLKKIILIVLLITLCFFSAINLFNPFRKTVSEKENRNLAKFPSIIVNNTLNTNFFSDFDEWFSDTFIFRDQILNINSKYKELISLDKFFGSEITYIKAKQTDDEDFDYIGDDLYDENEDISDGKEENKNSFNQIINDINEDQYQYDSTERHVEYVGGGFIVYNGIPYVKAHVNIDKSIEYLDVMRTYSENFGNVRLSVILAPQSSLLLYGNKKLDMNLIDQSEKINALIPYAGEKINIVNPSKRILDHRDEYLYFKSDHHWTNRCAYYAYQEFCESVGETAPAIDDMKEVIINNNYVGSIYSFTNDERLKAYSDTIYGYISTRSNVMTVLQKGGVVTTTDNCIREDMISYSAFISGDNPFTIITVPSNPKDKSALVIKDSFGCAFVPYLVNNYGNIFVIDPRHTTLDILDVLKDYPLTDIISVTAIYEPGVDKFRRKAKELIEKAIKNREENSKVEND